jgi:hypothetical protein
MLYRELCNGRGLKRMWGFGIYLMHLSDYLAGRKHKKKARTCEVHRRKEHPEAHPRREESPEA